MKASLENKLNSIASRHEELSRLLSDPVVIGNNKRFAELSKEYAHLDPVVMCFKAYLLSREKEASAQVLLEEGDDELRELAEEELKQSQKEMFSHMQQLEILLLPKDPDDLRNVFLEIRAGAGGDEAGIFVGNLYRMYSRYAERQGWVCEIISESLGEKGGYKEIIVRIIGKEVYSNLKFESGTHRVQRVPETEAQGRIHTSTCTVAVMPEVDEVRDIEINPADIRVDTYRASGAGGQHVNRTDSAVRLTHGPTGIVVECQDERSQHKNRARAMSLLKAKILDRMRTKQRDEQAETRRSLIGSGDRSERIRTYNYPQGRLTDHRINLTLYKLESILDGDLESMIVSLAREYQADCLASLDEKGPSK